MSASQRSKGQRGEREVAAIIREHLGLKVTRNWQAQSAEGGEDLAGIPGWALEVKYAQALRLTEWWSQTLTQAAKAASRPALVYRQAGYGRGLTGPEKWLVRFLPADVGLEARGELTASLLTWMDLVREQLSEYAQ